MARTQLESRPLISLDEEDEEIKQGDEEEIRRQALTVGDYDDDEIEDDDKQIDWDFAMDEILKLENRKKDKAKQEAQKKI